MAGTLGDLVVALHADTAAFTSDMGRAAHISEREFKKIMVSASILGTAIGQALNDAGKAAFRLAGEFFSAAADLDDMAEKTGASVEELSKLSQQAFISGTALETVESGLIRLAKSLNATDEESKKATRALDALGLKAEDLKKMDTAQAMKVVAIELNKFADGGGKAALAMDLLSKSGAQMLPFLKDMANDGELSVRVTARQAAEAEELGKSWRRLSNDAKGVGQALALDIIPWLQKSINEFREGIKQAGGFWEALKLFGTMNPFRTTGESVANLRKTVDDFKQAREEMSGRGVDTTAMDKQIQAFEKRLEFAKFMQRQDALGLGGDDTSGEMQRFGLRGQKVPLDYEADDEAARKRREAEAKRRAAELKRLDAERTREAENIARLQSDAADQLEKDTSDAMKFVAEMQKKLNDRTYFENIYGEEQLLGMSIEDIQRFHQSVLDGADAIITAGDAAMLAYAGFDENGRSLIDTTQKGIDVAKELGLTFSSAFEDAVLNGKKFRDVLNGIAQDVARILLRKSVTEPLANAVGGLFKGGGGLSDIFKGIFGGSSGGGGYGTIDPTTSGIVGSFASGTDYVPRTGLALVHQGEKITPAGENGGGNGGMTVNINAPGADRQQLAVVTAQVAALRNDLKYGRSQTDARRRRVARA